MYETIPSPAPSYASFLQRLAAYFMDNFILSVFNIYLLFPVLKLYGVKMGVIPPFEQVMKSIKENPEITLFDIVGISPMDFLIFTLATVFTEWLYFAGMESSPKQGTLGKMLMNIKVTDMHGKPVSFGKASVRFFSKLLSRLILYIGFIIAAFTEKKQALHDIMAGCLVLRKGV